MSDKYIVDGSAFAPLSDVQLSLMTFADGRIVVEGRDKAIEVAKAYQGSPELSHPYPCCGGKLQHHFGCSRKVAA